MGTLPIAVISGNAEAAKTPDNHTRSANLYPTRHTVSRYFGCDGLSSIFSRILRMNTVMLFSSTLLSRSPDVLVDLVAREHLPGLDASSARISNSLAVSSTGSPRKNLVSVEEYLQVAGLVAALAAHRFPRSARSGLMPAQMRLYAQQKSSSGLNGLTT